MSGNVIQITPFMHVADVHPAAQFFVETLGFTALILTDAYAYVELEGSGIRILRHADQSEIGAPHGGFAYYVDVRDLDGVLDQLGPRLSKLPRGSVHGPVDQAYGQRELLIRAPDGNLVVFGQPIDVV